MRRNRAWTQGSATRGRRRHDPQALTIAQMIAAMRHGVGRRPGTFPFPPALLRLLLHGAGRPEIYERLAGSLVVDSSALMKLGWMPPVATPVGLAKLMQATATIERPDSVAD